MTPSSAQILEDPKRVIPVSEEMLTEVSPEPMPVSEKREFVLNSAAGGKVHVILSKGEDLHPRHWRTRCGWYFGRGLTNYSIFDKIPSGQPCKKDMYPSAVIARRVGVSDIRLRFLFQRIKHTGQVPSESCGMLGSECQPC